jgi:hypothetical protein
VKWLGRLSRRFQEIPGRFQPRALAFGGHDFYLLPGENHSRIFKSIEWIITYVIASFFIIAMDLYVFIK